MHLSGPVAITAGEGLSRGFRGEVIGFDDGAGLVLLRGVWTDAHGNRIFSALRGDAIASGRRIAATITGGTGRYAGITGEYSFEWQYVVEAEAGTISGRAIALRGRYRVGEAGSERGAFGGGGRARAAGGGGPGRRDLARAAPEGLTVPAWQLFASSSPRSSP